MYISTYNISIVGSQKEIAIVHKKIRGNEYNFGAEIYIMKGEWIEKEILRGKSIKIRESGSKEKEDQSKTYNKKKKEKA